jgi:uncharacterized protein with von Willebrand factor type A (vWA) domain
MVGPADLPVPQDGKLAQNITHFARALRRAGLPVGTGRVLEAIRAVEAAGFSGRGDFYHVLHGCFVSRPEHREVFAQIFRLYWRDPRFLERMMSLLTREQFDEFDGCQHLERRLSEHHDRLFHRIHHGWRRRQQ